MKILILCDVDPILPAVLQHPPDIDIWKPLDQINRLIAAMGDVLPVITWLIRSDESVRFCTQSYASGFTSRQKLWRNLMYRGHELGWHMHNLSFSRCHGSFGFDPEPYWLSAAHDSLAEHFHIRATRVGWDYGSVALFNSLDKLGIQIDFSAIPGNIGWHRAGRDTVVVDWRHCPRGPYHPDRDDYRKEGPNALRLLEVPITQFPNSLLGIVKRCGRRIGSRCFSLTGLRNKTLKMTDPWPQLPLPQNGVAAFFFHPEELTEEGVGHFVRNVELLRQLQAVEFVTAMQIVESVEGHSGDDVASYPASDPPNITREALGCSESRRMPPSTFENLLMLYARRFPIRRGKLRVIDSLWQAALSDRCTDRVATLKHGRFKMSCDLNEMLQRQFYFFGTYFLEEDILACWQAMARSAQVILDVGANAGIYSLAALAIRPDAIVHAFEPTPEIAARLRATVKINGLDHLHVHQAAVSIRNGAAILKRFRGHLGTNEGMNFVSEDSANADGESVPTVCLDQFCRDRSIDHVDLLKLDIQGHEHSALKGAEHLIGAGRIGTIFMELNWSRRAETKCAATESVQLLEQADFLFSRPGKRLKWRKPGDWLRNLSDVVARRAS